MVQVTRERRPRRTYEAEQMEAYRRRVCNNLAALFVSIAIPHSKKTAICSEGAEGQPLVFTSTVVIRFMPRQEATVLGHENWRDLLVLSRRIGDGIAAATKLPR
jgi:hypothetical protein